jgi:hypothetical protein
MRPEHRVTHRGIYLVDDAHETLWSDNGTQSTHSGARASAQNDRCLVTNSTSVKRLGGNEAPAKPGSEPDELAKPVVFPLERTGLDGGERKAIEVLLFGVGRKKRLAPLLGALLKKDEGGEERAAHPRCNGVAHGVRECAGREGQNDARCKDDQIDPVVASYGAGHELPQVKSLVQTST